ncbi:hypothetical protein Lal_00025413 [Lupinus albus]|nr:hypothetical protein Lal_00025413 [Lupinus albus]
MMVPLYSYGCEKKNKKALSSLEDTGRVHKSAGKGDGTPLFAAWSKFWHSLELPFCFYNLFFRFSFFSGFFLG